jgi:beta-N-acetylhexosaminidase
MAVGRIARQVALLSLMFLTNGQPVAAQGTPEPPVPVEVQDLFDAMTPEERVGQLFLVTFTGVETGETTQIYDLIVNQHVGGVVLLAANDNFAGSPDTVTGALALTRNLQQLEWSSAMRPPNDPTTGRPQARAYVPLFVATLQDGDGAPGDQILTGLTALPSPMAIGATWSPELAGRVGEIMGRELSALGINMVFGPSLDVLENPSATPENDLGSGTFGGDPFWVSVLGSAYVSGLHAGSQDRLLVVPKHFPGRGSSDRSSQQEVATVRKSLEELKQIELAPFFAVTRQTTPTTAQADALLVSHIRYQGFQGNIRATTKPLSFDAQALASILGLPELADWREAGGLLICDDLGTNAVRQFYSTATNFPARTVARDAFVAGNDLLFLGNIIASNVQDNYTTVLDIIGSFSRKYREDPAFAQRVDASALRILLVKRGLYDRFDYGSVVRQAVEPGGLGEAEQTTFEVASRAATLLSPDAQELSTVLQAPPRVRDHIVFFTDSSTSKQCSECAAIPDLAIDALERAVAELYGPQAGNQTSTFRLSSYSFEDAANLLAGESPPYLQDDLTSAAWVVFSLVDNTNGQSGLLSNFLTEQQDVLREKRVILFTFGSPTFLDATDISRLTAYYALYSKQGAFVKETARLLFQEVTPPGASPVSVPSLGYDLRSATAPDPNQIIRLVLDLPPVVVSAGTATPEATPVPLFRIGDTIGIRTGVIKDHNGHPVPDGTVATFSMQLRGEGGEILQQVEAITAQGIARVALALDKPGLLEIGVTSDPARVSEVLQLQVSGGGQPAAVTVIVPQFTQPLGSPVPRSSAPDEVGFVTPNGAPSFSAWVSTVMLLAAGAIVIGLAGTRMAGRAWGVRWALGAVAGGLIPYNYLALRMPGGLVYVESRGIGGIMLMSAVGMLIGWGGGWLWWRRRSH